MVILALGNEHHSYIIHNGKYDLITHFTLETMVITVLVILLNGQNAQTLLKIRRGPNGLFRRK